MHPSAPKLSISIFYYTELLRNDVKDSELHTEVHSLHRSSQLGVVSSARSKQDCDYRHQRRQPSPCRETWSTLHSPHTTSSDTHRSSTEPQEVLPTKRPRLYCGLRGLCFHSSGKSFELGRNEKKAFCTAPSHPPQKIVTF